MKEKFEIIEAVGYSRISKEDLNKQGDVDSESIKNQNMLIQEYVEAQGWVLREIYSDDDFKGSDRERPDFNRMLSDTFQGKNKIIVCKTQARFARDIEMIEKYVHGKFIEHGIRFIAIVDNIDTGNMTSSTKKVSQIHSLTDTWYLEDLSENVSYAFGVKRKNGEYIGSWALYGYFKNPENKNALVVDPVAAKVVNEIFELYAKGTGIGAIANILNSRGISNPLKYKQELGMKIGSKSRMTSKSYMWRSSTISEMLTNEMYIGNMVQGRLKKISYKSKKVVRVPKEKWIIKEGTHEPIINLELWNKVQSIKTTRHRARKEGTVNIFSGKIRCLECNELMHAVKYPKIIDHKKSDTEFYSMFRCSKKLLFPDSCDSNGISMLKLEEYVINQLNELSQKYFNSKDVEELLKISDFKEEKLAELSRDKEKAEGKLKENMGASKALYMDKLKGVVSEEQFIIINQELMNEINKEETIIGNLEAQIKILNKKVSNDKNLTEIVSKYKNIKELNRGIILELIDCIYVGKKDSNSKDRTIKIVWNF